jgi:hypothetical protein
MSQQFQNIDLTKLNQLTTKSITDLKLTPDNIKEQYILILSCIFLMKTYRINDFMFMVNKLKDEEFKKSFIYMNRVIFNMNVFTKLIDKFKK